ncbi:PB1 domain-containing [Olea europaea subsp. europaea]|uniref:PB1 domain-containing n=2 Tax=Olea europaea subsp. europaea TaxID=158383 RepID=A0A8S0R876_OLEEU|nr:PB1 domain-containing [Olea europaea subsp. europaea]
MELAVKPTSTIKFLCSYGGRILPRYPDGKLRYHGGETRVHSVERSISFAELVMKLGEMCGRSVVNLRCQLPTEDLDALVSITSDEDLANLIEEYDRVAPPPMAIKIRAFLSAPKTTKNFSSPPSTTSPKSSYSAAAAVMLPPRCPKSTGEGGGGRCFYHVRRPPLYLYPQPAGEIPQYAYRHRNSCNIHLIHSGSQWYIKKNSRFLFISRIQTI